MGQVEEQQRRDEAYLATPDPERIFLDPKCTGLSYEGRAWSTDKNDCEEDGCEMPAIEYVRLDIAVAGGFKPKTP